MENLIERKCPLCEADKSDLLVKLNPEYFINSNPSLDLNVIKECGIMDLHHIPLVQCKKCKFVYTKFVLNDYWIGIVYNEIISAEKSKRKILQHSKRFLNLQLWYELYSYFLNTDLTSFDNVYLLEYGCGWGDFLSIASSYGVECIGIETDKRKLNFCLQKGLKVYTGLDTINADNRFNIFVSNQVFEHIIDPVAILLDIKNLLTKDFIGHIAVPNYSEEILQQSIKQQKDTALSDKNLNSWEHLNYFSPEKLWDFIDRCGFEIFSTLNSTTIDRKRTEKTSCYFRFKNPK